MSIYRCPATKLYGCSKLMRALKRLSLKLTVLSLLLPAGCGSLPRINPDMSMHPSQPIQIKGAHGPLSKEQSKAILARLKRGIENTNILDRHLALEQAIGGSPLVAGNKVELLVDGQSTYNSMFATISGARDHINMETYILEPDEIGQRFVAALLRKQREGVQVNLIYDSVGSLNTTKEFFRPLIDAGANILEYNPINPFKARKDWQLNERDHRKLLVVDGRIAYLGGVNISSVYYSGSFGRRSSNRVMLGKQTKGRKDDRLPWRDTHVRVEGPVVVEFQKLFMNTWEKQKGKAPSGRE